MSKDWARESMRGTQSNANVVVYLDDKVESNSGDCAGEIWDIKIFEVKAFAWVWVGGRIFAIMLEAEMTERSEGRILQPAEM